MGAESDPKMDPFRGGRMSENTMNLKGFGSKPALRGDHLGSFLGPEMAPFLDPQISETFRNLINFN